MFYICKWLTWVRPSVTSQMPNTDIACHINTRPDASDLRKYKKRGGDFKSTSSALTPCHYPLLCSQFDREHFSEVFVDLKWFESKVGNKYLNEAAGLAAEEADVKALKKRKVNISSMQQPDGWHTQTHCMRWFLFLSFQSNYPIHI